MKINALWVITVTLCLAACSKQEPAEPQQPESEPAAAPPPVEEVVEATPEFDQGFMDHMHAHAEQLDDLMFALADGDLDAAMTPAYWMSRHEAVNGVPEEWQQHITAMREAALAVEAADDIETAQAAAEDISAECQACHIAAGVNVIG